MKKILFIFLLFLGLVQGQSVDRFIKMGLFDNPLNYSLTFNGSNYYVVNKETQTHFLRVFADGGTIGDTLTGIRTCDSFITACKQDASYSAFYAVYDPNWGCKVNAKNECLKLYNLKFSAANPDLVQSDSTKAPTLVPYITNGSVTTNLKIDHFQLAPHAGDYMKTSLASTWVQPITVMAIINQVTWGINKSFIDGNSGVSVLLYQNPSTPNIGFIAGGSQRQNSGLAVGTFGIVTAFANGTTSSYIQINNGTPVTGNVGTNNPLGLTIGARGDLSFPGNIQSGFIGISTPLSATQQSHLNTFLNSYYKGIY